MILVAIGANLPGPNGGSVRETCQSAAVALDALPGLRLGALSRWWATPPVPSKHGVPDYVNGVAVLGGIACDAVKLLAALQAIEARFGRTRPYPDAPRTLDLDLLDLDGRVRDAPDPILPHPRLHLRAFVLAPLCDVAPCWVHPVLRRSATALLAEADQAGIRPL